MTVNGEVNTENATSVVDEVDLVKEEFFLDIVEKQFGKCTIKKMDVQKNSGGGENYISVMMQARIEVEKADGSTDTAHYMVKMMPHNDPQGAFKKQFRFFAKEVEMYESLVPKFEQLLRESGIETIFAPKYWKSIDDPETLIMEDLKVRKYENINRLQGMDMQHAKLVLNKLAQFHAASACTYEKFGPFSQQLTNDVISKDSMEGFRKMQPVIWANVWKNMRLWKSCQRYVDYIEGMQDRIADLYINVFNTDPEEFNVLLHGDLWANNIMFLHDENGEAKDVLFVDLQVSRYGSPIHDLIYFIFSSTEISIKVKEFDYFISYYHKELIKNLKILKYSKPMPTLIDLHVTAVKKCFLGVVTSVGVMSVALLDPNNNASIENFLTDTEEGEKFKQAIYTNPRYIKSCEMIFPFLENRGAFDL